MPTCKRMTELATDRAEGHLGFLARLAFDRHLARCDGCRAYVRQLEATRRAAGLLPEPQVPPALTDALLAQFDTWAGERRASPAPVPKPAPGFAVWPVVVAVAALGLLVAFAGQRSRSLDDWLVGSALAVAALAVAAMAGRFAAGIAMAAVAAAAAAALAAGRGGALEASAGVHCLAVEVAAAAAVGGAAWMGWRGKSTWLRRQCLGGGALAGAMVADAALQITCGAREALPHLAVFHLGGVALVAGGAWLLAGRKPAPAAAR